MVQTQTARMQRRSNAAGLSPRAATPLSAQLGLCCGAGLPAFANRLRQPPSPRLRRSRGYGGRAEDLASSLAARGESPAAFDRRCIPKLPALGHFLQGSNTAGILPPRALPAHHAPRGAEPRAENGVAPTFCQPPWRHGWRLDRPWCVPVPPHPDPLPRWGRGSQLRDRTTSRRRGARGAAPGCPLSLRERAGVRAAQRPGPLKPERQGAADHAR